MKKQIKFLLFALCILLMVTTMVVMASAATDGATTKEDGHYYQVTDANGTTYYTGLQAALNAVENNGTITVLSDVTESAAIEFNREGIACTIDGDSHTLTLSTTAAPVIKVSGASSTLKVENAAIGAGVRKVFQVTGASASVEIDGCSITASTGIYEVFEITGTGAALTVVDSTVTNTSGDYIFSQTGANTITVKGGAFTAKRFFKQNAGGGSEIGRASCRERVLFLV